MKISVRKCPICNQHIKLNGVGPSNSPKFSWTLRHVYAFSCKLFRPAGDNHDMRYHMLDYGKKKADDEFLAEMLEIARGCSWYSRGWYKYQARKFYLAVAHGGQNSYDEAQAECLCALNLASRKMG